MLTIIIILLIIIFLTLQKKTELKEHFPVFWERRSRPVIRRIDKYHYRPPYRFMPYSFWNHFPFYTSPRIVYLPHNYRVVGRYY